MCSRASEIIRERLLLEKKWGRNSATLSHANSGAAWHTNKEETSLVINSTHTEQT